MRLFRIFSAVIFCACALFAQSAQEAGSESTNTKESSELPKLEHFDLSQVDSSVDPCTDFYKYACGKWMAANPIPADQVWWSVDGPLQLWNEMVLRDTLEKAAVENPNRTPNEQKIGDYWASCMDEKGIDAATPSEIEPELDRIAALRNKKDLAGELAHLHETLRGAWAPSDDQTDAPMLGFTAQPDFADVTHYVAFVDQAGMGLPGRDFYINPDDKSKEIRSKYVQHIKNMLVLGGEDPKQAATDADVVMAMETEMAQAAMDPVKRRDPKNINHPMTLAQVKALTPSFDWNSYLKDVNAPTAAKYIVTTPEFFQTLQKMINEHPLDHWKAYLRWQMLHGSAPFLSQQFVDENFDFFAKTLNGAEKLQPRWRRCVRSADAALGEALGQAYVSRAFPPESKARVLDMVKHIEEEMGKDIQAQDWMAAQTKQQAITKLNAVLNKIGYPDKWRDYSAVKITRDSYLKNVQAANDFEFERWVHKIGQPLDRTEWGMTPPTINAYEDAQTNTINFPAGILQSPYFDPSKDDAVNYGGSGAVIGHELIHGFDDQGRKFDAQGNLRDWWTPADASAYEERGKCISNEYTQEVPEAGVKQNGLMTQGEDTADNGGTHLAYLALQDDMSQQGKKLDDKDPQGFTLAQEYFIAYANSWCSNIRPQLMRTAVLTDPHSMPKYRVNNVVSNMPEFWSAFSCKKGQPMVRENACRIW